MLYRNAENDDYRAILKFEKKVFKKDFSAFLPKVYSSENLCADTHIICKDGKKYAAHYVCIQCNCILAISRCKLSE